MSAVLAVHLLDLKVRTLMSHSRQQSFSWWLAILMNVDMLTFPNTGEGLENTQPI